MSVVSRPQPSPGERRLTFQARFQAAAEVVILDTGIDTSFRDRLVRTRKSYKVERGGKTASTSFKIRDNKRYVEWLLKQSLNAFKLIKTSIQLRFNMFQHG